MLASALARGLDDRRIGVTCLKAGSSPARYLEAIMGTWSTEPFGNDAACDWAARLIKTDDLSYIEATLRKALDCSESDLHTEHYESAVAAAEVLAKLLGYGRRTDPYPSNLDEWIRSHPATPSPTLLHIAHGTLERIHNDPSLRSAWHKPASAKKWAQSLRNIQAVLQGKERP